MKKWLKVSLMRVLCVLLVINTFPGGSQTSEAAAQSIQYNQTNNGLTGQLGTHDFQYAYADFSDSTSLTNGLLLIGGSSTSSVKLMSAFAKYSIPASGFPSSGQKAVLSLRLDSSSDTSDTTYPPILQVWQYTGSTNYSPINGQTDPSLWPQTMASLRSNPDFTLLDTKNAAAIASAISNGTNLTFDVDAAVKGKAGNVVQFLITGPESSSKPSTDNRFEVTSQAPFLTEVAGGPPAAANTSTVTASPITVTANGTASSTITVTVKDASNNLLSGKTVTLTKGSSNSVISPSSQVTNASGVATFTVTNTKAEQSTYTASVAADAVTITQTASVTFQSGPVSAGQSTVTASPTTLTANNTSSSTITVTLKDANNNLITGQDVTLSQGSGSSTISPTLSTTNTSGVATFTVRNTKAEAVTYTASANGVSLTSTPTVTFQAGAVNASTSTITASKANVIANNTDNATITVTLRDINNNPVGSQAVTLAQGSGSSTITATQGTTNASGVATFTVKSTKAETVTYSASAGGTTTASTASVTFQPGAVAASQSTVSVSKNSVFADGSDSSTVTVTLNDVNGNTVSGKSVTLSQGSGSSTINPSTAVTTNASGQAIFTVTSVKAETVTYTATDATDSLTVTQTGTVTFVPGAVDAAASTVVASKANVIANNVDSATITVTLRDAGNNAISNRSVTLSQGSGSSTITATQGTTNASGVATFTVKSTKAEGITYTATAGGVTVTATAGVTFQPGSASAAQSKVEASKANVSADNVDTSIIMVTLTDSNGNPIGGKSITLAQGSGGSTISPSTAVMTNASGQVAFTVKSTRAETVIYTATDATDSITLTQTASVTFNPGAVDANLSTITTSKANVAADNTDTATITVHLKDSSGNAISGKNVTLSQGSGSSAITATQGTTDASGVATFTVKSTKAEAVTYTAVSSGVTLATTTGVTFQPGAVSASASTVVVSKANVAADGTDNGTVTVTLNDVNSNPISGKSVTLSQGSGSSAITPSTAVVTNASGQAVFTVTNNKAETVTYTATNTTDSMTITQTRAVTFDPGAVNAALSTVTVSKTTVAADNTDSATVTVTIRDSQSNLISGKNVTLSQGSGSSTITPQAGVTTDANGVATFILTSTKAESVTYTAIAGSVTLSLHPVPVTFTPGAANGTTSQITASKASVSANGSDFSTILVTVKDIHGNVIEGRNVTLQQGSGGSLISPAQATTNVDGVASFTATNTRTENVVYTAKVVDDNVSLSHTANVNFLSSNANLASLQLSEGALIPIFTPAETSYFASVQNDVYRITFTPTTADSNATIRINGNTVQSGSASAAIELQTGNNTVVIEVLAADGQTSKTYTIQVMREPNKDARLKALSASPVALTPAFNPAITEYTVNVANNVDQYSVQADVYNPLSTVTVTGATYDSNTSTYGTNLQVGTNTITLKVTAQDGQTSASYTIKVIRADALDEVKNALNKLAIGYNGNDSWEFVTQDLILPTTQDGLPVVWSSNQSQVVQSNGGVMRPGSTEASVILTATIQHNGAQLSRTFLVIVKPQGLSIINTEVTRNVPIRVGDSNTDVEQTPITRKTLSDGSKIDKVIAGATQLSSALQSAMNNNQTKVRVVVSDVPNDPASEVTIDVPATSYADLANKVDLNLDTDFAQVILSKNTLSQLQTAGQSLFFRFVPIREAGQVSQVTDQALNDPMVKQTVSTGTVAQVGTPMTIETNYSSFNTTLLFPAAKLNLPAGTPAQQAAYAAGLYVYIQHSDGEIALQRGTVQMASNGQVEGVTVNVNKFSTFTILHVEPKRSSSGGGGGGGTTTPTPTPTPTPSNPTTPTQPSTPAQPGATGEHTAYINGYPDHTFRPSQTTTRAELAAMLWRVMQANGSQATTSTSARYSDVPSTHWASDAIRQLQAQQIMLGVSADRFAPTRPLTRAEFATLAVRWQKLTPADTSAASFKDVNGHWAAASIATLVQTGVVKGYSDGTFRPNEGVTRAELVTMMNRLLKRGPLTSVMTPTWKDVPAAHWAFADIEEASLSHNYQVTSDGAEKWISNK